MTKDKRLWTDKVSQLSWLERYTDNVEVGSSSLPETTKQAELAVKSSEF